MPRKICFIIPSLGAGGAERVLSFLANKIDSKKFDVTLLVLGYEKETVYDVSNVKTKYLNRPRLIKSLFPIYSYLKTTKPDLVLSSIGHVNLAMGFLSIFLPKTVFVAREASVISKMDEFSSNKNLFPSFIIKYLYRNLDAIVCQSLDMKKDMQQLYSLNEKNTFIINNPAPDFKEFKRQSKRNNTLKLLTVGRLSPEKGHARILKIISQLPVNFIYTIIGSGTEKRNIEDLAQLLNISDKIKFVNYTSEVATYLIENDIFLQGSYVEGFPNALMESCAVGTPVIAFNAPGGTKEIIVNEVNGYLVENETEFLEKLVKMIDYEWNFLAVRSSIYERFSSEIIVKKYQEMFEHVLNFKEN